jgi:hypothetical protein
MTQLIKVISFGAILSALAAGCATVQDPGQKGFLSDYSNLEEIEENHLVYTTAAILAIISSSSSNR